MSITEQKMKITDRFYSQRHTDRVVNPTYRISMPQLQTALTTSVCFNIYNFMFGDNQNMSISHIFGE